MTNRKALWLRVGLAFLAFILIGSNDGAFGVILPSLQGSYGLDKSTVSILFLCGTFGYLTSAFSSGLLVERLGTHLYLTAGPVIFLAGAATMALALGFGVSMLAIFIISFGIGIIDAGLNSYVAGLPNNTTLLNYLHAFYGVGALIGPLLASAFLAIQLGWNSVYVVSAVFSVIIATGIWFFLRGEGKVPQEKSRVKEGNVLAAALRMKAVWIGALMLLVYVGGEVSLGNWSYSLLTEDRNITPLVAGWMVSGFWLGLTLGRLFLGRAAKRLGDKMLIQLCILGVFVGLLLVWLPPHETGIISVVAVAVGLGLAGFSLGPIFPTTIAIMSRMIPERILASAIGFLAAAGSMGGALFPWIAGNLEQSLGLSVLLPYVIGLSFLMLLCWLLLQANPAEQNQPKGAETQVQ